MKPLSNTRPIPGLPNRSVARFYRSSWVNDCQWNMPHRSGCMQKRAAKRCCRWREQHRAPPSIGNDVCSGVCRTHPRCSVDRGPWSNGCRRRASRASTIHGQSSTYIRPPDADRSANVLSTAMPKLAFLPVSVLPAASRRLDPGDCPAGEEEVHI